MPVDYTQTTVHLDPHKLVIAASGEGSTNLDLYLDDPGSDERATATANTVQVLESIKALATSALNALK